MSKINPVRVRIAMLKKGIKSAQLQRRFKVSPAAISMALSGQRTSLLEKISRYVKEVG
jgi:hypothetical protein